MAYMYRYGITGLTSIEQTEWRPKSTTRSSRDKDRPLPPLPRPATAVGFSPHSRNKPNAASFAAYQLSLLTLAPVLSYSSLPPPPPPTTKHSKMANKISTDVDLHYQTPSTSAYQHAHQQHYTATAIPWQHHHRNDYDNNNDDGHDRHSEQTVTKFARLSGGNTVNYSDVRTTDGHAIAAPTPAETATTAAGGRTPTAMYYRRAVYDDDHDSRSGVRTLNPSVHHHHAIHDQNVLRRVGEDSGTHNKLTSTSGSNISTSADGHHHHQNHYRFVQPGNHNHRHSGNVISAAESKSTFDDDVNNISFSSGTTTDNEKLRALGQRQQEQHRSHNAIRLADDYRRMHEFFIDDSSGASNKFSGDVSNKQHLPFPPAATSSASSTITVKTHLTRPPPTPPPLPLQSLHKLLHESDPITTKISPATHHRINTASCQVADEAFSYNNSHASEHYQHTNKIICNTDAGNDGAEAAHAQIGAAQHRQNGLRKKLSSSSSNSSVIIHIGLPQQQHHTVVSTDLDALPDDSYDKQSTPNRPPKETAFTNQGQVAAEFRQCNRNNCAAPQRPPTLPIKTAKLLALQQKHKAEATNSVVVADLMTSPEAHQQQAFLAGEPPFLDIPPRVARPKHLAHKTEQQNRRRMTTTIDVEQLFRLAQQHTEADNRAKKFDTIESAISAVDLSSAASTTSTLTANRAQRTVTSSDLPENSEVYQIAGGGKTPEASKMHHFESTQSSFANVDKTDIKHHGRAGGYWRRSEQFPPQTTYAQSSISVQLLQDAAINSVNNGAAADAVFVAATNAVLMATRAAATVGQHRFHSTNSARGYADTTNLPTVRRLVQLVEMHQYHEGVKLIAQMQQGHFSAIVLELPLDTWIAHYPKSLPLLDAVYARVASLDHTDQLVPDLRRRLHIQPLLFHIVKFYATHLHAKYPSVKQREPIRLYDMQAVDNDTRSLLRSLYKIDSRLTSFLKRKKKALEDALQSLGEHGLIHCIQEGEDLFYSLSDALRKELDRIITAAKVAVETADAVEPAMKPMKPATLTKKSLAKRVANRESLMQKRHGSSSSSKRSGSGPSEQSHQHMLQLKYDEIQTRVKRNTRLLQTLQPIRQIQDMLNLLMSTLQRRISNDEVVLSQMSELKKGYQFDPHTNVADTLKMFIAGCDSVLYMLHTLNGIPASSSAASVDTGSLVISMTNHNQESDQISSVTSIASSANQLQQQQQQQQSNSLRQANVRMFGDSRANSYTAADFRPTYFHNQSPSPSKKVSVAPPSTDDAADALRQKQEAGAVRPQHLLYSAAVSSPSSSNSPTPIQPNTSDTVGTSNTRSSVTQQIYIEKHQAKSVAAPISGVSSSSGVSGSGGGESGGSPCNSSSARSSSSHSPVMSTPSQSAKSAHGVNVYSSATQADAAASVRNAAGKQPSSSGGDGATSEVSGYQSGHSSPATSARDSNDAHKPGTNNPCIVVQSVNHEEPPTSHAGRIDGKAQEENSKTKSSLPQQQANTDPYSYNPFHQKSPSSASSATIGITVNGFAPPGSNSKHATTSIPNNSSQQNSTPPLSTNGHRSRVTPSAEKHDDRADLIDCDDIGDDKQRRTRSAEHLEVREQYERLYCYARDDVKRQLDLNDISSTSDENEELKDKLIFSVMVSAIRAEEPL